MALVLGRPPKSKWTVSNHLVEDRGDGLRGSITAPIPPFAKRAKTHFSSLERVGKRANLVEARLTGRTHQGPHPPLGGGAADPRRHPLRHAGGSAHGPAPGAHAAVLGVDHPVTGERLRFTCGLPDDVEQARRGLIHAHSNPVRKRKKSKVPKKRRR